MKNIFFTSILALILAGCSDDKNDTIKTETNSIIGKWNLIEEYNNDGTKKKLDDCDKKGYLVFSKETYNLIEFGTIGGECKQTENQENVKYKLVDDVIEIPFSYQNNQGQTITGISKMKIKFTENGNLETYEADENGIPENNFPDEVWSK